MEESPLLEECDTAKSQENTWPLTVFLTQTDWDCPARSLQYISYSLLKNLDSTNHLSSFSLYAV